MLFRYSMIQAYLDCPIGFRDRYILHKPEVGKSSALELGTALHLAIKSHFEGLDATKVFTMYWDSLKDTPMVFYRYGWQELRDLAVNKWIPNFVRLHAKKFENSIQEQTLEMPFLGHTLQGTYDIHSKYEGLHTLADWKTSSREYKKDKILKNPQMYIYSALLKHHYDEIPEQLMYKVFRKDNGGIQTLKIALTHGILDAMMKNVENIVKTMLYSIETNTWYHSSECYCERETNEHQGTVR